MFLCIKKICIRKTVSIRKTVCIKKTGPSEDSRMDRLGYCNLAWRIIISRGGLSRVEVGDVRRVYAFFELRRASVR